MNADYSYNFDIDNPMPHCPVVLVLDTSHSMWGQGLSDMMQSLKVFYSTVSNFNDINAQIDIAAVSMGDNLCLLEPFTPLSDSKLPERNIRPKGDTPIGAALTMAHNVLQMQISNYQRNGISYVRPHLVLLSDGKSTDDFSEIVRQLHFEMANGKLICMAIALGKNSDMAALGSIIGSNRILTPNFGGMQNAFAQIGQLVSQSYENEAHSLFTARTPQVPHDHCTEYLLDGTNIMFWANNGNHFTIKYLCMLTDYLKREGKPFKAFFDASTPYKFKEKHSSPDELHIYNDLLQNDTEHFFQVPGGTRADDFILQLADRNGDALIISNDRFKDHVAKHPWLANGQKRVIAGKVIGGIISLPQLSWMIPEKTERTFPIKQ